MTQSVLTKTAGLAWSLLESYGIDPLPLFRKAHINPALMNDMSSRTNWSTQNALWTSVSESVNDPCFGLKLGGLWHPSYMHALGYAWLSSSTLYSALGRLSRFIDIVNPNISVDISSDSDNVTIEVRSASDSISRDAYWYADADMSILMAMCRANCGDSLNPVAVEFRHAEPDCAGNFFSLFRCPVEFGAPHDRITFSRIDVDKRLPGSNTLMSQVHDQEMVRYLAGLGNGDITHKVKNAILELLPDGRMSDAKVAETLFMSNRNLQRKLEAQGTTFKTILTELRKELASIYIQDPQLTLTEVSFMLGFSEMSAFSRAFKQWTGQSPKAQRNSQ
jgi:AraC-like DNA-binding protein